MEDVNQDLEDFLKRVSEYESTQDTYNPWASYDPIYDFGAEAPRIRLAHLREYLGCRIEKARYLLVAEAVGYQGAKFSGVPLTSERILLGYHSEIEVSDILPILKFKRTSNALTAPSGAVKTKGFAEPTATIVWSFLGETKLRPTEVVLWNIFPFHPFRKHAGALSNRAPRADELALGKKYLDQLIALLPPKVELIAIGEKAAQTLDGVPAKVRHPANGGARIFREQLSKLVS